MGEHKAGNIGDRGKGILGRYDQKPKQLWARGVRRPIVAARLPRLLVISTSVGKNWTFPKSGWQVPGSFQYFGFQNYFLFVASGLVNYSCSPGLTGQSMDSSCPQTRNRKLQVRRRSAVFTVSRRRALPARR